MRHPCPHVIDESVDIILAVRHAVRFASTIAPEPFFLAQRLSDFSALAEGM